MADSWEDDDFFDEPQIAKVVPVVVTSVKSDWDDEDQEEDVKESWDEDEEAKPKKASPKKEEPKKESINEEPKKESIKEEPKKESIKEEAKKPAEVPKASAKSTKTASKKKGKGKEEPKQQNKEVRIEDPTVEKQRREKLVQQSDLENAVDLFSGVNDVQIPAAAPEPSFESLQPTTEAQLDELAKLLIKQLSPHEKSAFYPKMVKTVIRHSLQNLSVDELKDVSKLLTVMINDKIKAEKDKPKKKAAPKKSVNYKDAMEDFVDDYDFL